MRRLAGLNGGLGGARLALVVAALCQWIVAAPAARAADPIRIGFGAQLTGPLASSGKANLLTQQIWAEEINAKGGLLGRKVELVYYDNQSNPATVPGLYTKLLDIDKVDLLMGEGTNFMAPALPVVMERKKLLLALMAVAVNSRFHYDRWFQTAPWGPDATSLSTGFFDTAKSIVPMPKTVALAGADAEFSSVVLQGARENAKKAGLRIVYDRTYPPNTVDYAPTIRAIQAAKPDLVFVASYPLDSVGMVRAAKEAGLKAQMFGGAMVGLQYASFKMQLGESLNGIVGYDFYAPEPTMKFPGIAEFLEKYQAHAREQGVDQLGYYQPPYTYAAMQILQQAVEATKSLDDAKLADYMHKATFHTIVGDIAFDAQGEWAKPRVLSIQFQKVRGNGLEQFMKPGTEAILYPPEFKSGSLEYPYGK